MNLVPKITSMIIIMTAKMMNLTRWLNSPVSSSAIRCLQGDGYIKIVQDTVVLYVGNRSYIEYSLKYEKERLDCCVLLVVDADAAITDVAAVGLADVLALKVSIAF